MAFLLIAGCLIFIAGNAWRLISMRRMPRPLRWDLYPIPRGPAERQRYGGSYFEEGDWWTRPPHRSSPRELVFVLKEVLLLRSVWENFHELWLWSWLLHWGLYLYAIATALNLIQRGRGAPTAFSLLVIATVAGSVGAIGLLTLRLTHPRLRTFTSRATIFNLLLLGTIFFTGALSALGARESFTNVLLGSGRPVSWMLSAHVGLVAFFLAYFPFSHMTHMYMKYFMWHEVRWDDRASVHDRESSATLAGNLQRPVSWAAPHIAASKESRWADVVTSPGGDRSHA